MVTPGERPSWQREQPVQRQSVWVGSWVSREGCTAGVACGRQGGRQRTRGGGWGKTTGPHRPSQRLWLYPEKNREPFSVLSGEVACSD